MSTHDDVINMEDLQNLLLRLSYVIDNRHPPLNDAIRRLRDLLRSDIDTVSFQKLSDEITKAITVMDDIRHQDAHVALPLHGLMSQLEVMSLPQEVRSRVKQIKSDIQLKPIYDIDELFDDVYQILLQILSTPGEGEVDLESQHTELPVADILLQLIDELEGDDEIKQRINALKTIIEQGIDQDNLAQLIKDIVDILSDIRQHSGFEREQLEDFLKEVTLNLNELDQHIRNMTGEHRELLSEGNKLGNQITASMSDLAQFMGNSDDDLPDLKSKIIERLNGIRQHFDQYLANDQKKHTHIERQVEHLTAKVNALQAVSGVLRERLYEERSNAMRDTLTGLYNRAAYNERLNQELSRASRSNLPLCLAVWDIDNFKNINDSYGHAAGDKVIKAIAQMLMGHIRKSDFVARYGGEEFVCIMPETPLNGAIEMAEKIRQKIEELKFHYKGERVAITISCGISQLKGNEEGALLFKRADDALYQAKQSGRNQVCSL